MKFVTYKAGKDLRPGILDAQKGILDIGKAAQAAGKSLPATLRELIAAGPSALATAKDLLQSAKADAWLPASTPLATPLPHPQRNIFCIGRNYKLHIIEMSAGKEPNWPKVPEVFTKATNTVVGPDDGVERHAGYTEKLDYEVELAVVIGKRARNIAEKDALAHVFGYTVVNDISARDAQVAHHQYFKGKSFDTFCPIGPCIVTSDEFGDPSNHRLSLKVNGKIRQDSTTSDLLFNVPQIIASLSGAMTLEPGDVIATGTPAGVAGGMNPPGWLNVGDVMEAEVEGIGVLRNKIIA